MKEKLARLRRLASFLAFWRSPKICVYTSIIGDYDELREPAQQSINCDFVCFTDNPGVLSSTSGWKVVPLQVDDVRALKNSRLHAKYPKILAHKLFGPHGKHRSYRNTIWVDASIEITSPHFVRELLGKLSSNGMALIVHPERECIYEEAEFCAEWPPYRNLPLRDQVAHYRAQGFPAKAGLMACGLIVRDHKNIAVKRIEAQWWHENTNWSYQDQLSLPYVLWKHSHDWDKIDLPLWANHLFRIHPHKVIDR